MSVTEHEIREALKSVSYPGSTRDIVSLGIVREVVVEGFTDNVGTGEYNLRLSAERAEAVLSALVDAGVEPPRIAAAGFGSRYPVANNETEEGRAINRRVEVVILEPGVPASMALRGR